MKKILSTFLLLLLVPMAHAQKIIFSDAPFTEGDRQGKDKVYTLNDKIYGRLIVPTSIETDVKTAKLGKDGKDNVVLLGFYFVGKFKVRTSLKEVQLTELNLWVQESDLKKNTLDFDILPDPSTVNSVYTSLNGNFSLREDMKHFIQGFWDLDSGTEPLEVRIPAKDGSSLYTGRFKMQTGNNEETKKVMGALYNEKVLPAMVSKYAAAQGLPDAFKKKTPPFKDKDLSKTNIKKLFGAGLKNGEVMDVAISDNDTKDYNIQLNELGQPTEQYTARTIYVLFKYSGKCLYRKVMLKRKHLGGGKYGELEFSNILTDDIEINCKQASAK
jgi:hypothetical protein